MQKRGALFPRPGASKHTGFGKNMDKIKVLIVDDHAIFRDCLRSLLAPCDDIAIAGEASNGQEGVDRAVELNPDVILMDLAMPVMEGLTATRRIIKYNPQARVVMVTQYEDCEHITSSIKAGASGYIPKRAVGSDLVSAIRAVHRGDGFLYPCAASAMIQDYLHQVQKEPFDTLSERERDILKMVAEGNTSRQIGIRLSISLKTVQGHCSNIMRKLAIHNRTELIKYAIRKGLVTIDK